jgi:hypothetical protein
MTEEFGVDLDEVFKTIDASEVLIVRFHLIEKRLLADFRTKQGNGPLVAVVPRVESVEDRFRSIKRLRPEFPVPERVNRFLWPRSVPVMLSSGVWQRLVDRASARGDDETTEMCGRVMEELMAIERAEVVGAIRGADHYETLWQRQRV